jgi:hypothetical protein
MSTTHRTLLATCILLAATTAGFGQTEADSNGTDAPMVHTTPHPKPNPALEGGGTQGTPLLRPVAPLPTTPPMPSQPPLLEGAAPDAPASTQPAPGQDGIGTDGFGAADGPSWAPDDPMAAEPAPGDPAMPTVDPTEPSIDTSCALDNARALIGMTWDDSLLEGIQAPGVVRVMGPNDFATMDYNPMRLNILLDAERTIIEASCG